MKKTIFIILICLLYTSYNCSQASTLRYGEVLNQAVVNSFDLKLSEIDIDISKAQLKAAQSDLYPTLNLQFNSEYNKDLNDKRGSFAYAGNTMITPYTQYRDMLYLTLSYNLFDFGVTNKKINIAKKELEQKKLSYEIQLKDLKLKILDLYSKSENFNNEIITKKQILNIYEKMFNNKEKMFIAGINNKLSIMDEAVKIAKTQNEIEKAKLELKNTLQDLSYYTSKDYDISDLNITQISNSTYLNPESDFIILNSEINIDNLITDFNAEYTPEANFYDLEIEKKKSELSILKRQLLPSFRFYTGYSLYGQNPNNYYNSVKDIEQRSLIIGISSTYVFFDGFKNKANREKTNLEIKRLEYEKQKKLSELNLQYKKSFQSFNTYNQELENNNKLLSAVKDKLKATERLSANKLIEQNELLNVKAELLNQEFEIEQNIINLNSKIEELKIIAGADI